MDAEVGPPSTRSEAGNLAPGMRERIWAASARPSGRPLSQDLRPERAFLPKWSSEVGRPYEPESWPNNRNPL